MFSVRFLAGAAALSLALGALEKRTACGDDWQPAASPLKTRWAADVAPGRVHAEYPRPQMVRRDWQSLNGLWEFEGQEAFSPPDAAAEQVPAPSHILAPFPVESALSGVGRPFRRFTCRRSFEIPAEWTGERVLLHFGAVDWEAKVRVNGRPVGEHRGGFDGFSFDITDALAEQGPQQIEVEVFDPSSSGPQPRGKQVDKPEGIYYTPSTGIWQTVWLEPAPAVRIESLKLVPNLAGKRLQVTVRGSDAAAGSAVQIEARTNETAIASVAGKVGDDLQLDIPEPHAWSPDDPFLYDLNVTLLDDQGQVIDGVDSYFGMRSIDIAPDANGVPRIRLNGEFVFQTGPLDQGFWPDGLYTAPTDEALAYDLHVTKELGFNMVRKHVKVEPERWYYWCDTMGLLVWQDMPSGDRDAPRGQGEITRDDESAAQFEAELVRLIDGRGNHPCIVMWVVFNEGWGQYDTVRIAGEVKRRDPSRLVNCASGWNDFPAGDVIDVHAYPGPAAPRPDGKRALVLGEFGGLGLGVDGHTWADKTWGYRGTASTRELSWRYAGLMRGAWGLKDAAGLSAVVYTQTTDVETEANGLLTYDREVLKVDRALIAAANRGKFPNLDVLAPTSLEKPRTYKYTFEPPAKNWFQSAFDDRAWKSGPGGFGTEGTPGGKIRTTWNGKDIWLRRTVELERGPKGDLLFSIHHDEDFEVYVNGVLAAEGKGYSTQYEDIPCSPEGSEAFRQGRNVIAVHCRQTGGGQYIDLGLLEVEEGR